MEKREVNTQHLRDIATIIDANTFGLVQDQTDLLRYMADWVEGNCDSSEDGIVWTKDSDTPDYVKRLRREV